MEWMGMIIVDNEFHERRVCRNKDLRRTLFVLCFTTGCKKEAVPIFDTASAVQNCHPFHT